MEPLITVLPLLYALFLWWATTGLIMAFYRSSLRVTRIVFVIATGMMLVALHLITLSARTTQLSSVYLAITGGIVVWGWLVASYYLNVVTGQRTAIDKLWRTCPASSRSVTGNRWQRLLPLRFRLAVRVTLYHELLTLGVALLLSFLTWSQPNRWGLWIFLALWIMHTSAKLNVFFGVRNFRVDFLPDHLHYLKNLLVRRPNNAFFPVSICVASSVALTLLYRAVSPQTGSGDAVGALLVATMITLGIVEHLMLVLPLPVALFGWGLRSLRQESVVEPVHQAQPVQPQLSRTQKAHGIEVEPMLSARASSLALQGLLKQRLESRQT